jgi:predicted DNA-binding transcriptional regulator YafY
MNLLLMLQSKRSDLTVDSLAEYFEVSRRTIFRDLRMLTDMEVPVTYIEGEGYAIPRGYNIPPLMFTTREIAIIMFGLSFVKSQPNSSMIGDAKSVELKIQNVVPSEMKSIMTALDQKVIVDPYLRYDLEDYSGGDWFQITSAIATQNTIRFKYAGKTTFRRVDPYILVYYSNHWNVIGYCHDRMDIRNFKIEALSDLSVLPVKFNDSGIQKSAAELIYRESEDAYLIDITVDNSVWSEFRKSVPVKLSSAVEASDSYRCQFRFENLEYLNIWLMRFAGGITVHSPKELKLLRTNLLKTMIEA